MLDQSDTLTVDKLMAAMQWLKGLDDKYYPVRIVETPHALADSEERNFPLSRHRSRRLHKKLIKHYGSEFKKVPTIWRVGSVYYAHPAMMSSLRAQIPEYIHD